jgi:hypothetical protein
MLIAGAGWPAHVKTVITSVNQKLRALTRSKS